MCAKQYTISNQVYTTHLINATIGRPSIANADLAIEDFTQRLLEEEGVEVVLHRGKVYK